jgi:hypothetical protein
MRGSSGTELALALRPHAHLRGMGLVQHLGSRLAIASLPTTAEPLFASGGIVFTAKALMFIGILRKR